MQHRSKKPGSLKYSPPPRMSAGELMPQPVPPDEVHDNVFVLVVDWDGASLLVPEAGGCMVMGMGHEIQLGYPNQATRPDGFRLAINGPPEILRMMMQAIRMQIWEAEGNDPFVDKNKSVV